MSPLVHLVRSLKNRMESPDYEMVNDAVALFLNLSSVECYVNKILIIIGINGIDAIVKGGPCSKCVALRIALTSTSPPVLSYHFAYASPLPSPQDA